MQRKGSLFIWLLDSITFIWGILAKYQILIYDQTSPKFETTINIKNKDKRVLNFICDSKRLHSIKETDTVLLYYYFVLMNYTCSYEVITKFLLNPISFSV